VHAGNPSDVARLSAARESRLARAASTAATAQDIFVDANVFFHHLLRESPFSNLAASASPIFSAALRRRVAGSSPEQTLLVGSTTIAVRLFFGSKERGLSPMLGTPAFHAIGCSASNEIRRKQANRIVVEPSQESLAQAMIGYSATKGLRKKDSARADAARSKRDSLRSRWWKTQFASTKMS